VSVDEVPTMDLSISTNGICKGDEVILTSNFKIDSNLRWWAKTANSNFTLVQEGGSEFSDTPEKQTTYKVTASSQAGCKAGELTESVNVFEPVNINVEDKKICEGESVSLSIEGLVNFSEITWTADGAIVGSAKTLAANPTSTTTYEISVKNGLCEGSAEATVEVVSAPKITAIEEVSNNTWQVEVNSETQPVYFEYGTGSGTTTSNQFPIRYGTEYTVSVSNEIGCKTDTSFVTPTYDIRLPAAFSPNGDGIDDAFVIENIDKYPDAKIDIYDRFGKKLVTTSGANYEAWDGTYNGIPLPSADYWYEIYVHEINKEYIGHFTLIRQ
jgi:gliding motility-associated-like protein